MQPMQPPRSSSPPPVSRPRTAPRALFIVRVLDRPTVSRAASVGSIFIKRHHSAQLTPASGCRCGVQSQCFAVPPRGGAVARGAHSTPHAHLRCKRRRPLLSSSSSVHIQQEGRRAYVVHILAAHPALATQPERFSSWLSSPAHTPLAAHVDESCQLLV